jgi:hypothetical protein
MPVAIAITSNAREVAAGLKTMPQRLGRAIARALDDQNERTVAAIITERMNFSKMGPVIPGGLRRQSGMAVKSIRTVKAEVQTDGVTSALGSNLKYVKAHEYGFIGTVNVRGHMRRKFRYGPEKQVEFFSTITRQMETSTKRSRRVVKVAGPGGRGKRDAETYVRAHSMQMNLPARHMFGQTLAARVGAYTVAVSDAITQVWEGKGRGTQAPSTASRGGLAP